MQFNSTPIDLNKIENVWEVDINTPTKLSRDVCDREIDEQASNDQEEYYDDEYYDEEYDDEYYDDEYYEEEQMLWNEDEAFDFELKEEEKEKEKRNWFCKDISWEDCNSSKSCKQTTELNETVSSDEDENAVYQDGICYDYCDQDNIDEYYEMLDRPLDDPLFQANPQLEKLDKDLRYAYYESIYNSCSSSTEEKMMSDSDCEETNKKLIQKYKETLNIQSSEAFEYIRRCHYCGSAKKKFSYAYCGKNCEDMHFDFNYTCYWNHDRCTDEITENCKMCNWNDYYKNPSYER